MGSSSDTAVLLASISLAVSITGLLWQLALYRLSGARLSVRLRPAVASPFGSVLRGPDRGWGKEPPPREMRANEYGVWADLALVSVTNIGRSAISVQEIGLDLVPGANRGWRFWRRHVIQGPPVPVASGLTEPGEVRLEPGQAVSVYLDIWALLKRRRELRPGRTIHVRASARPAGRRAKRSRIWKRWAIEPDTVVLWPYHPADAEQAAFQELFRQIKREMPDASVDIYWWLIRDELRDGKGDKEIAEHLQEMFSGNEHQAYYGLLAFHVHTAYEERRHALASE